MRRNMETDHLMMMDDERTEPPAPPAEEATEGDGYCLVLCVYPDGTFAVSRHPLPEEEQEQGQPGVSPEQRFPDLGSALRAMAEAVQAGGQPADQDFQAGYAQG